MLRGMGYSANDIETMSPARLRYHREFHSVEAKAKRAAGMAAAQNRLWDNLYDNLNAPNPTYARLTAEVQYNLTHNAPPGYFWQRVRGARPLDTRYVLTEAREHQQDNAAIRAQVEAQHRPQAARDLNLENLNEAVHRFELAQYQMHIQQQQMMLHNRPGQAFRVQDYNYLAGYRWYPPIRRNVND